MKTVALVLMVAPTALVILYIIKKFIDLIITLIKEDKKDDLIGIGFAVYIILFGTGFILLMMPTGE